MQQQQQKQQDYSQIKQQSLKECLQLRELNNNQYTLLKKGQHLNLYSIKYNDFQYNLVKIEGDIPINIDIANNYYYKENQLQLTVRHNLDNIQIIQTIDDNNQIILVKLKSKFGIVSAREVLGIQYRTIIKSNNNDGDSDEIDNNNDGVNLSNNNGNDELNNKCIGIIRGNIKEHEKVKQNKNVIRAEGKIYGIFLTRINDKLTHFEAYLLLDPKGSIPAFVVNYVVHGLLEEFEQDIKIMKNIK